MRKTALDEVPTGLLVVGLHAGEEPPASVRAAAEPALSGGDFSGKEGETAMLYTDLANPTSNGVYQRIGYRRIGDAAEVEFVA